MSTDLHHLPPDLPVPVDDGAARHLVGRTLPALALPATIGGTVDPGRLAGRVVLFCYPMTGTPGTPLPEGWDAIPGARGCTPQACRYRDEHAALAARGAVVFGVSSQSPEDQREAATRLGLPYALLSDEAGALRAALDLPAFVAGGATRLRRLTMLIRDGRVERVVYPIFPSDADVAQVLAWLDGGDP